ncbi:hypothetical protein INR49_023189 [Caranx melampygus]|nr:hypothetical protein INR49_023189 [Caranx melampygus]
MGSQQVSVQVDEGVPGDSLRPPQLSRPDQAVVQKTDRVIRAMFVNKPVSPPAAEGRGGSPYPLMISQRWA